MRWFAWCVRILTVLVGEMVSATRSTGQAGGLQCYLTRLVEGGFAWKSKCEFADLCWTQLPICRSSFSRKSNSDSVLPIWVGVFEANAIALEIEKVSPPRPMTHDLLKNAITGLGATVQRVVVTELRNDTFFAAIWATRNGEPIVIDARPSDAIALAMRTDCPFLWKRKC